MSSTPLACPQAPGQMRFPLDSLILRRTRQLMREGEAMADVPAWRVQGDWFDVCKCSIPAQGTLAQAPSEGDCEGMRAAIGIYIDERADEGQREALMAIFGGHAGGWPGQFAESIAEVRGVEYAPITFEIAD